MASKIFVGNLDYNTTKEEVQALFGQIGELKDVFLPVDRETGRKRGFAFVEFASDEDAAKAIEKFNGYQMGGRALRVNAAENRPRGDRPSGPPRQSYQGGGFQSPEGGGGEDRDFYGSRGGAGKPKGSRRNLRAKKRSL